MEGASGGSNSNEIFSALSRDFEIIRQRLGFVDHTELVKLFFGSGANFEPNKLFISAPPHFCKSTNMDMIRKFYGIKQDGKVEENYTERHMFQTFEGLKIMEKAPPEALKNHFCAHPVLFVNFWTASIRSYDAALSRCFRATSQAYRSHKAFLEIKLQGDASNLSLCTMWWNAVKWPDVGEDNVKCGLQTLCGILFTAYKKRVLVLVDECDAVITAALSTKAWVLSEAQIDDIAKLMEAVFGNVTEGEIDKQLQGVLLTGISYISGIGCASGYSGMIKTTACRFLDDTNKYFGDLIVESYGLSLEQLDDLLRKLQDAEKLKDTLERVKAVIKDNYNSYYTTKKVPIFSLWSVLFYLTSGSINKTHAERGYVRNCYKKAFGNPGVGRKVRELIAEQDVDMRYEEKVTINQLVRLRDEGMKHDFTSRNVLFSLLMDIGFLSNTESATPSSAPDLSVTIPNKDVMRTFERMFTDHYIQVGPFDQGRENACARAISLLADSCMSPYEVNYNACLETFHKVLEKLFEGFKSYALRKIKECMLRSLLWRAMAYSQSYKVLMEHHTDDDEYVDLWLERKDREFTIVIEMKVAKEKIKSKSSMYALKQANGEEKCASVKTPHRELEGKNYLLIGLSMNCERLSSGTLEYKPSFCVQSSQFRKITFVSKTEHDFPCFSEGYYQGCYDLFKKEDVLSLI